MKILLKQLRLTTPTVCRLTQHPLMCLKQEKGKLRDMPGQNPNLAPTRGDILWWRVYKTKQVSLTGFETLLLCSVI